MFISNSHRKQHHISIAKEKLEDLESEKGLSGENATPFYILSLLFLRKKVFYKYKQSKSA